MASLIPLALGNECYSKRNSVFLQRRDDLPCRFPSAPSKQQKPHVLRPRRQLQQKKPQPQPQPESQTEQVPKICATPRTNREWKATLGEIKREYMNRRFRQCSARCHEVLVLSDELGNAHPVHLVYLRFYAATALEMQARAIHHSSPFRTTLLEQAYDHYSSAFDLASQADQEISRPSSRINTFSRLRSAHGSNVSGSTASTRMSSPVPSLGSLDGTFQSPPKKKKVAFCDELMTEPIIRPDSPTLGFDEWLGRSSPEPVFPESILKSVKHTPMPTPITTAPILVEDVLSSPDLSEAEDMDPFFQTRSIHRFCTILSSIRRQITSHMTTLDIEIAACQIPTAPVHTNQEMRALDIKARIERLRASGWKRARFDVQRYETLRENALADMTE